MATLTTREMTQTDGTAGKGLPLTNAEVDQNFINLNDDQTLTALDAKEALGNAVAMSIALGQENIMANTFKLKTKAAVGTALTSVYTVPASTTAVVIGLTVANILGASITASAQIVTASTTGENADDVYLIRNIPLPLGSSVEMMSGNKINLEAGDIIKIQSDTASALDAVLSIMEIT